MRTHNISNTDDVIDSRDVIARIEELESERQELLDAASAAEGDEKITAEDAAVEWEEENGDELKALQALAEEAEGYAPDWQYGATLIRDNYFVEAMQELVQDIGDLPRDIPSYLEIDWEKTAENLKADYTSVDFDGVTYWIR